MLIISLIGQYSFYDRAIVAFLNVNAEDLVSKVTVYIESVQQELELHPPSNIINWEKRETLRNLFQSGYEEDVIADQLDLALSTVRALIKEEMHLPKH